LAPLHGAAEAGDCCSLFAWLWASPIPFESKPRARSRTLCLMAAPLRRRLLWLHYSSLVVAIVEPVTGSES
jgi:hypothetical protein